MCTRFSFPPHEPWVGNATLPSTSLGLAWGWPSITNRHVIATIRIHASIALGFAFGIPCHGKIRKARHRSSSAIHHGFYHSPTGFALFQIKPRLMGHDLERTDDIFFYGWNLTSHPKDTNLGTSYSIPTRSCTDHAFFVAFCRRTGALGVGSPPPLLRVQGAPRALRARFEV